MIKSKSLRFVAAGLLIVCAVSAAGAETTDTISGRQLLKMMRQQDANDQNQVHFENRTEPASGAQLQDQLLKMLPEQCLFCVRVNNFDYTLSQIDQFLAGASPMPMAVSMLVRMKLAEMLGSPQLGGVNTGGNFAFFATTAPAESGKTGLFQAALIPVTDYEHFVSSNPNVGQPDEKGVSKIKAPTQQLESLAINLENYVLLTSTDRYDQLLEAANSLRAAKPERLATTLDAAEIRKAIEQPIWAYGDIQLLSKTFGPVLFEKLDQIKAMVAAQPGGQAPAGQPEKILTVYASVLKALMEQTQFFSLTANPKPNVFNITETISALPGTDMAAMFSGPDSSATENRLLGYLEDGMMMNLAGKIDTPIWKKINEKSIGLLTSISGQTLAAEDKEKIQKLAEDSFAALGSWMALSLSINAKNRPPFAANYAIEVKDTDKFNTVMEQATDMMNTGPIGDAYKSMGIKPHYTLQRRTGTYKGVSIDSAKLVMKPTDPNSQQGKMIEKIYGSGVEYRWAMINGLCIGTVAGDVDATMRTLIDKVKAGGPKQIAAEPSAALALLPKARTADIFGTLNYLRVLDIIPVVTPIPMPPMNIPTKSNIAFAGTVGGGKMTIDLALPKEHLTEIMGAFMMMQQQKMQMMQQSQPTPTPGAPGTQQHLWTCPMHPQVRMPQKGKCPICNMDLVRAVPPTPTKQTP